MSQEHYNTIRVRMDGVVCYLQLFRPHANNSINFALVNELLDALAACKDTVKVVVIKGLANTFCDGADFESLISASQDENREKVSQLLYQLWLELVTGPYVTISDVKGKVNAGGIGFLAASDIVICDASASFCLSELLFGLIPACVMPFLIRRIGFAKSNYLALTTQKISPAVAQEIGLIDAYTSNSDAELNKILRRLRCLSIPSIIRYKKYRNSLDDFLVDSMLKAVKANREMFSDQDNLKKIADFIKNGRYPWEE